MTTYIFTVYNCLVMHRLSNCTETVDVPGRFSYTRTSPAVEFLAYHCADKFCLNVAAPPSNHSLMHRISALKYFSSILMQLLAAQHLYSYKDKANNFTKFCTYKLSMNNLKKTKNDFD